MPSRVGNVSQSNTSISVSLAEGIWFWNIGAFNGLNTSYSTTNMFSVCHPGYLGFPILNPEPGYIAISTVNLTWALLC